MNQVNGPKLDLRHLNAYMKQVECETIDQDDWVDRKTQTSYKSIVTAYSKSTYSKKGRQTQVRFNENVVTCLFREQQSIKDIQQCVKALISQQPSLGWLNPQFRLR